MLGLWCYHSPCCRQNPQCFFDIHPLTLHSSEGVCCVLSCVLNGTQVLFCGVRMNMIHDIRQATRNLVPGTSIYQVPGAWYQYIYTRQRYYVWPATDRAHCTAYMQLHEQTKEYGLSMFFETQPAKGPHIITLDYRYEASNAPYSMPLRICRGAVCLVHDYSTCLLCCYK